MGMNHNDLNECKVTQSYVTLEEVTIADGVFYAMADSGRVCVVWRRGCNDWPEVGQRWEVRILGSDVASGIMSAQALIRAD